MKFDEWLKYYILDNKINPAEVIYEGIYKGRFRKLNILDIAYEIRNLLQKQKKMRQQLSRKALIGEDIKKYLQTEVENLNIEKKTQDELKKG